MRAGHRCMDKARQRCHERNDVRVQTFFSEKRTNPPHGGALTFCSPLLTPLFPPVSCFFAQFSSTLLSLTPRVSAPASSSLTPSSSPQPSQPRRSSSIIRSSTCPSPSAFFFFFYFYLLFHTVILEGLRRPASLSQHTNAAIQRIKERICWLRQKPFPCLLITKWSPDYRGWEEREARYSIIAVIDDIHINIYPLNMLWFGAGLRLNPVH